VSHDRDLLTAMVRHARHAVPGCTAAALCVLREGAPVTVIPCGRPAARLQMLQLATGRGPGVLALTSRREVVVELGDADHDEAWCGAAEAAGISGVVALPLARRPDLAATLTCYRRGGRRWPRGSLERARGIAEVLGDVVLETYPEPSPLPG
jgi:hypothetical protein